MITEIVSFDIAEGLDRQAVMALYERTAPAWRANPDLIRKTYLYDPETRRGGGVYLWKTLEAAHRAHDADWCAKAEETYGSVPRFQYFETALEIAGGAADQ